MTVPAVDAESGDVMLMTERHGLRLAYALVGYIWGTLNGVTDPDQRCNNKDRAEDSSARQRIRAAMKNLRHSLMRSGRRDPADRPLISGRLLFRVRKPPTEVFESSAKLEIINISRSFVAPLGKKNFLS